MVIRLVMIILILLWGPGAILTVYLAAVLIAASLFGDAMKRKGQGKTLTKYNKPNSSA
jgi:hypothetical protein